MQEMRLDGLVLLPMDGMLCSVASRERPSDARLYRQATARIPVLTKQTLHKNNSHFRCGPRGKGQASAKCARSK